MKWIKDAVNYAVEDILSISKNNPNEVLPQEAQIQCSVFSYAKSRAWLVHAEAGYPHSDSGEKCDLRICAKGKPEAWIEIKIVGCGSGWNSPPSERFPEWKNDCKKLSALDKSIEKYFMLFGFFDRSPENAGRMSLLQQFPSFKPGNKIVDTGDIGFSWRGSNLKIMRAYVWRIMP